MQEQESCVFHKQLGTKTCQKCVEKSILAKVNIGHFELTCYYTYIKLVLLFEMCPNNVSVY